MLNHGHQINIEHWYDLKTDRWHAKIKLREYRGGRQYGGTLVWEMKADRRATYDSWMNRIVKEVNATALALLPYKIK